MMNAIASFFVAIVGVMTRFDVRAERCLKVLEILSSRGKRWLRRD